MITGIMIGMLVLGILAMWFVVVRPIIRSHGFMDAFFVREESLWKSLAGYRTMAVAYGLIIASALVELYDLFAPVIAGTDITPVLNLLPSWAWPLIWIGIGALFRWLRLLTTKPEPPTAPMLGGAEGTGREIGMP